MATNDVSFPKIGESSWWKLRDKFKQKVPTAVTSNYIATVLSMSEKSAVANIIGPLKKIGLIDENGKPTDLAYDWRDDNKYPKVCDTISKKVYPEGVRDIYSSDDGDPDKLISWFMNQCRCGDAAARMYASFYRLLVRKNPTESEKQNRGKERTQPEVRIPKRKQMDSQINKKGNKIKEMNSGEKTNFNPAPQLHINIQLHISPETTLDKIEKIFESMAKHLKSFKA